MKIVLLLSILLPATLVLLILLRIIHASRRSKLIVKTRPVVGLIGIAETDLNPEGLVLIEDEIWRATASTHIKPGMRVRIIGVEGVILKVILATEHTEITERF
jgi:membrane-bound serine protease (ClpP class)